MFESLQHFLSSINLKGKSPNWYLILVTLPDFGLFKTDTLSEGFFSGPLSDARIIFRKLKEACKRQKAESSR